MSQPRIAAFARLANGNLEPRRVIAGQATRLGRTVHGLAYDSAHDEIVVPNPMAAAVLVFRGGADGSEAPVRIIQGPRTTMANPHSVNVDPAHGEILVGDLRNHSVLVFPWDAAGDVQPRRRIQGPRTRLGHVVGLAVDPSSGLLAVANDDDILVFNRLDCGDVAPRAVIRGPRTGLGDEPWQLQIHKGRLFVAASNHLHQWVYPAGQVVPLASFKEPPPNPWQDPVLGFIGVWNVTASGDAAPLAVIRGPLSRLVHPSGLALDVARGEIMASDSVGNAVFTYHAPELFAPASGPPTEVAGCCPPLRVAEGGPAGGHQP